MIEFMLVVCIMFLVLNLVFLIYISSFLVNMADKIINLEKLTDSAFEELFSLMLEKKNAVQPKVDSGLVDVETPPSTYDPRFSPKQQRRII